MTFSILANESIFFSINLFVHDNNCYSIYTLNKAEVEPILSEEVNHLAMEIIYDAEQLGSMYIQSLRDLLVEDHEAEAFYM